jgi:hypothetical protein
MMKHNTETNTENLGSLKDCNVLGKSRTIHHLFIITCVWNDPNSANQVSFHGQCAQHAGGLSITYTVSDSRDDWVVSSHFNINLTTAMHITLLNDDDSAFQVRVIHTVITKALSLELQARHLS